MSAWPSLSHTTTKYALLHGTPIHQVDVILQYTKHVSLMAVLSITTDTKN